MTMSRQEKLKKQHRKIQNDRIVKPARIMRAFFMQGCDGMKDKRAPPERWKHQDNTGKRMHKRKEEEPVMGPGNEHKNTGFCFPEYLKNIKNEQ